MPLLLSKAQVIKLEQTEEHKDRVRRIWTTLSITGLFWGTSVVWQKSGGLFQAREQLYKGP